MKNFKQFVVENNLKDLWFDVIGSDFESDYLDEPNEFKTAGIVIEEVDHTGGEGQGDIWETVFSVTQNGVCTYYQLDGFYASHYGHEWHDRMAFYEVEEKEVMVKQWVKV